MRRSLPRGRVRGRKPVKRFDPNPLRELLSDGRMWAALGVVTDNDSDGSYADRVYNDDGDLADVIVEFTLQPGGEPVTARLSTLVGGNPYRGIFVLPEVGDEWCLVFPAGELEQAVGGFALSRGRLPASAAQANRTNLVIVGSQVVLTDATGGGERKAARINDTVRVTIPINTVVVAATSAVLNAAPIEVDGTITSGSDVVKLK